MPAPIDLRKLAHFVRVGEELSFTRAADGLHMSQQALSSSVRQLESELGAPLLERSTRRVALTDAGVALLRDARGLLAAAEAAADHARRVGSGEIGELRIGHTPAVTGIEVNALGRALRRRRPETTVSAQQLYPERMVERLLAAELDVALGRVLTARPGLELHVLGEQELALALERDHPLAGAGPVALADIADDTLAVWGHPGASRHTDLLVDLCRAAGFEPRIEVSPIQGTDPVAAAAGGRVALVTAPPGPAGEFEVVALADAPRVPLHALTLANATAPVALDFLAAAADAYRVV